MIFNTLCSKGIYRGEARGAMPPHRHVKGRGYVVPPPIKLRAITLFKSETEEYRVFKKNSLFFLLVLLEGEIK